MLRKEGVNSGSLPFAQMKELIIMPIKPLSVQNVYRTDTFSKGRITKKKKKTACCESVSL